MNAEPPVLLNVSRGKIVAVVLIYAVFAAAWILLSDRLVDALFEDPAKIIQVSLFKGWFYVFITSLLLYGLLSRWMPAIQSEKLSVQLMPRRMELPALVLAMTIVVFTLAGIAISFKQHQDEAVARLQTVADLKTRQIADWLKERQGNAEFVQTSVFFAEHYRLWQESGDQRRGEQLQMRLKQLCKSWGLLGISLIDVRGSRIWSTDNAPATPAPELLRVAGSAREDGKIYRLTPYRDASDRVLLDFVVPLTALGQTSAAPIIVLHIDLAHWLFPDLDIWPVISATAETLLVRRDGDQVSYLNNLRHQKDAAVKLRLPLNQPELLAAQLLRGEVKLGGRIGGLDYRGVPALGVAGAVNGTDWYLLAKMDLAEAYAEATENAIWIGLVGILALLVLGVSRYLLRQMQQLSIAQAVQASQAERLEALNLLEAIADGSDDAIFAKDLQGRYMLFNRAAGVYTGKTAEQVLGCDDTVLFPKQQAEKVMAADRQVITENRTVTKEESLDTVNGERVFLVTKGPLRDEQGRIIGIFGISRDITTRTSIAAALIRQQEELISRNRELERFNRAMVGRELDMIELKRQVNRLSEALGQQPPYSMDFVDLQGGGNP